MSSADGRKNIQGYLAILKKICGISPAMILAGALFTGPYPVSAGVTPPYTLLLIQEEIGQSVPIQGHDHIQSPGSPHIPYNSDPPTSGPHVPYTIRWGIHKVEITREIQVHNLEDGGVILHYNCSNCDDLISKLEAIIHKYQRKAQIEKSQTGLKTPSRYDHLLLAPYPGMDHVIALTAWGRIDKFNEFDQERIERFIEAYVGIDHHPRQK